MKKWLGWSTVLGLFFVAQVANASCVVQLIDAVGNPECQLEAAIKKLGHAIVDRTSVYANLGIQWTYEGSIKKNQFGENVTQVQYFLEYFQDGKIIKKTEVTNFSSFESYLRDDLVALKCFP